MFAKLAQFRLFDVGRVAATPAAGGCQTDNRAGFRPILKSRRLPRPILVCRWQKAAATGALECAWRSAEAPAGGDARPPHSLGPNQQLTDARVPLMRPARRAA